MIDKNFYLLCLCFALILIPIKTELKIISAKGILGQYTKCQNMRNFPVFTIYLKGDFNETANYVENDNSYFPENTFSVSSTLSNETDKFPLSCSNIAYKNITHYQVQCTLLGFESDYVGPFRMTKLSSSVNSTSSKALETEDEYIINLKFDDDTVFGNTNKNVLRDPYLVGSNHDNKVIINYTRSYNIIHISYVGGEVTNDNLPKVESNGHFLNCEVDNSFKLWEICHINEEDFPADGEYSLNIYDQCNLLYDYHPNFYTTKSPIIYNNVKNLDLSIKVVAILVSLILL